MDNTTIQTKVTINTLNKMKREQQKIAMLTCYDASFAKLLNLAKVDIILIGDSLGNVVQGHMTTIPVTINDIVYHTQNVVRGNTHCFLIADMPFGTYDDEKSAYINAVKLMQAGANMVKIEGGAWCVNIIEYLTIRSIPVCAHLGLMPQSVHKLGSLKQQANNENDMNQLLSDAALLEQCGVQMMLFESIPSTLMQTVQQQSKVPTIAIGAGKFADGQVLVLNDILGIFTDKAPPFSKNYLNGSKSLTILQAISEYVQEVKTGLFPN